MHYDATNDLAFCHLCMIGAESGKLSSSFLVDFLIGNMLPDVLTGIKEV